MNADTVEALFSIVTEGSVQELQCFLSPLTTPQIQQLMLYINRECLTPLMVACAKGHYSVVEYLLGNSYCDVNLKANYGDNALCCAVSGAGSHAIMTLLIRHGADVNQVGRFSRTAIYDAIQKGDLAMVKELTAAGAYLEYSSQEVLPCLVFASWHNRIDIVEFFLNQGVNKEIRSHSGNTAILECADRGYLECLKLLEAHGADLSVVDKDNLSLVMKAAANSHGHIVEYLLDSYPIATKIDALELLGAAYVDVDEEWQEGIHDLPLGVATWKRALETRSEFSLEKLPPSHRDVRKAYRFMCEFRSVEELDGLVEDEEKVWFQSLIIRERILGAVHVDTSNYVTERAKALDSVDMYQAVQLYLHALHMQIICKPNDLDIDYCTTGFCTLLEELFREKILLQFISGSELLWTIETMIRLMNVWFEDTGRCLSHVPTSILLLLQIASLLEWSIPNFEHQRFRRLFRQVVQSKAHGENGQTFLHLACSLDSADKVIQLLLEAGANVNAVDNKRNTPLHLAAGLHPSDMNMVQMLIKAGAKQYVRNMNGHTPLDIFNMLKYSNSGVYTWSIFEEHKCKV